MHKERNNRLDGVKLILIILVVIGHSIEHTRYTNVIGGGFYSVIYSFHMPLFVFLSGYFAKVDTFEKWKNTGIKYLETFLVIMIPQSIYYRTWHVFLNPENSGWYLMSLVWWYGILLLTKRLNFEYSIVKGMVVSFLISFLVFLLPLGAYGSLLSFNRTIQMLPFFFVGYLVKNKGIDLSTNINKITVFFICMATVIVFLFITLSSSRVLHVLEYYNIDVWTIRDNFGIPIFLLVLYRILLIICAAIVSLFVIITFKFPKSVSVLGSSTLLIFVVQGIFAHIISSAAPRDLYIGMFIAIIIFALSVILIKTIDCRYITNPVSTFFVTRKKQ